MSRPRESSFDRVRPRGAGSPAAQQTDQRSDQQGRRALFSVQDPQSTALPGFGAISIECGSCGQVSVLGLLAAFRRAVPSLYLPMIKGRYPLRLRCPACSRWTWTRVRVRL